MFIKSNHPLTEYYLYEYELNDGVKPYEKLEETGLITHVSGKKPMIQRLRLTKVAKEVLKEFSRPPLHPLAEFTLDYTRKAYEKLGAKKEYIVGGQKILGYISGFLDSRPSEYTEKMIIAVIDAYISQFEYDQKYLHSMKYLFFKPQNAYATKYNDDDSPLAQFVLRNQDIIKNKFKCLNVKSAEEKQE